MMINESMKKYKKSYYFIIIKIVFLLSAIVVPCFVLATKITVVSRDLVRYGLNDDASIVFDSNDQKAHLNLITCEGIWDEVKKTYPQRLVIFADRE